MHQTMSDRLAVVLWWFIELYSWSRFFAPTNGRTDERTKVIQEVLADLKMIGNFFYCQYFGPKASKFHSLCGGSPKFDKYKNYCFPAIAPQCYIHLRRCFLVYPSNRSPVRSPSRANISGNLAPWAPPLNDLIAIAIINGHHNEHRTGHHLIVDIYLY